MGVTGEDLKRLVQEGQRVQAPSGAELKALAARSEGPEQRAAPTTSTAIQQRVERGGLPDPFEFETSAARERRKAANVGVGSEGAPAGARFGMGLALPVAGESPEERLEVARRALGGEAEVRIGPDTGELEFRRPGEGFQLFNPPGLDPGDLPGAVPEVGVLGAGAGIGALGGVAGLAAGGPFLGGTGTVAGLGLGEAAGEFSRIMAASSRGLVDVTLNEALQQAAVRGGIASGAGLVGGAASQVLRRFAASRLGVSTEVVDALGDQPLREAIEQANRVGRQVEEASGEAFPLTLGQTTRSPEVLRGEQAAMTRRDLGAPVREIEVQQRRALGALEERTFGEPAAPGERRALGSTLLGRAEEGAGAAEDAAQAAEGRALGAQVAPEAAAERARASIREGQEEVLAPLRKQFDELQQERGFSIDLAPLREEVGRLQREEGQDILRSIDLRSQSRLLQEAEQAGARSTTLGELQRALRDVRRELRRPGIADEPQRRRILQRVEGSLRDARQRSLPEDELARVLQLEDQFRQAQERFNRGVVGAFTEVDQFGQPQLTGEQAFRRLTRSPEDAEAFVDALADLPNADTALARVREGALGFIARQARSEAGDIDPGRLRGFLRGPQREALARLFRGDDEVMDALGNAQQLAQIARKRRQQVDRLRNRVEEALGVATADPSRIASTLLRQAGPREARRLRRILPEGQRELFNRAMATQVRDEIVNERGGLSAEALDNFLKSDRRLTAETILGRRFTANLGVIRDALRQVDRDVGPGTTAQDLAFAFGRGVPGLTGVLRFARVPFAPLSVRGRAFTAGQGALAERTQRQLARALTDPERVADLAALQRLSPRARRFEIIMGRLGLPETARMIKQLSGVGSSGEDDG